MLPTVTGDFARVVTEVIDPAGWGPMGADADQFVVTARPRGAPG